MNIYLLLAISMGLNLTSQESGKCLEENDKHIALQEESLFLGSGMGGVVITLTSGYAQSDQRQYISHLDRSQGSIEAFVPTLSASPLNRLLDVVSCEHPIDHRDAGIDANRGDPF